MRIMFAAGALPGPIGARDLHKAIHTRISRGTDVLWN